MFFSGTELMVHFFVFTISKHVMKVSKNPFKKLRGQIKGLLAKGLSPAKLALGIVLGIVMGIVPMLGINTVVLAALATTFRLNMALVQSINYLLHPLQILLYIPFLRMGAALTGHKGVEITIEGIKTAFATDWLLAIEELAFVHLMGLGIWVLCSIPIGMGLYFFIRSMAYSRLALQKVYVGKRS